MVCFVGGGRLNNHRQATMRTQQRGEKSKVSAFFQGCFSGTMIGDWYRALNGRWRRKFYLPCFVLYFPDQKKTKIYSDYVTLSEVPLRPIGRVDTDWESFLGERFMIAFCSLWRVEHFFLMPQLTLDLLAIPKSRYISSVIERFNEFKSIKNIQSASNINIHVFVSTFLLV